MFFPPQTTQNVSRWLCPQWTHATLAAAQMDKHGFSWRLCAAYGAHGSSGSQVQSPSRPLPRGLCAEWVMKDRLLASMICACDSCWAILCMMVHIQIKAIGFFQAIFLLLRAYSEKKVCVSDNFFAIQGIPLR